MNHLVRTEERFAARNVSFKKVQRGHMESFTFEDFNVDKLLVLNRRSLTATLCASSVARKQNP